MTIGKTIFNLDILAFNITYVTEPKPECNEICRALIRIPRVGGHIADHWHCSLRARRERPCCSRPAEQRDELAAVHHSITSSAATCKGSGTVRPSALAVLRFIRSSNLVGCKTGKSAGFSPLRMRPV